MRPIFLFAIAAAVLPGAAVAGRLDLRILDASGRPVPDAVVTVYPAAGAPKRPISFPWGTSMVQENIAFNPHVLIVPVGATVRFPNRDKVRHHVYSFSKPARFELKLFGKDETRSYTFTSAGAVALGCNIHDSMSGFIKVVDTPFAAKSAPSGSVQIDDIPAGATRVVVWHPRLRTAANEMAFSMPMGAGSASRNITLDLR